MCLVARTKLHVQEQLPGKYRTTHQESAPAEMQLDVTRDHATKRAQERLHGALGLPAFCPA